VPSQLHTVGIEHAAVHVFHISRAHIKQVQESCTFVFKYSVWMIKFSIKFVACVSFLVGLQEACLLLIVTTGFWIEPQTSDLWCRCL